MNETFKKILFLGIGGFIGSNARYWITRLVTLIGGKSFPAGTLTVNIIGCFFLGFLSGHASGWNLPSNVKLLLGTGLLGALTTFSTFSVETLVLFQKSTPFSAGLNLLLNIIVGLSAAAFGLFLAQKHI
ncbi:MAG: fluoride efflux transporter CrcB [Spirochaetales bacterium]|nr:fluoride efflux transporter CrcB [Spirochaetales bacterium]